jgi:hypothetical protein
MAEGLCALLVIMTMGFRYLCRLHFNENNMNIKNDIELDASLEHIDDNWYLLDITDDADSELVIKRDNLLKLVYDVEEYEKKYVFN